TSALERMAAHLTSAGRLLIDVFIPLRLLEQGPADPILKVDLVNPATGSRVRGWNTYIFDQTRQIEHRRHIFEVSQPDGTVRRREFTTRRRYWFRRELAELFEQHGLRVDGVFTGYTGAPRSEERRVGKECRSQSGPYSRHRKRRQAQQSNETTKYR